MTGAAPVSLPTDITRQLVALVETLGVTHTFGSATPGVGRGSRVLGLVVFPEVYDRH